MNKSKLLFLIIDALGISASWKGNVLLAEKSRYFFDLWQESKHFLLENDQLASSFFDEELIHAQISSGQRQFSNENYLTKVLQGKSAFEDKYLQEMYDQMMRRGAALHLVGALPIKPSKYACLDHILPLIKNAKSQGARNIYLHLILDETVGIDKATTALSELEKELDGFGAQIATISGKNYLEQKNIKTLIKAMAFGEGQRYLSAGQVISRLAHIKPVELTPSVVIENGKPVGVVGSFDGFFFYNHNTSEIEPVVSGYLSLGSLPGFLSARRLPNFLNFFSYFSSPMSGERVKHIINRKSDFLLPEIIAAAGYSQVQIADNSRMNHFGKYFNGGKQISGLEELFLPSSEPFAESEKVMDSIYEVLEQNQFEVIFGELSILDHFFKMSDYKSALKAFAKIDQYLKKAVEIAEKNGYCVMLTSNHGGVEKMADLSEIERVNMKTTNPVPFFFYQKGKKAEGLSKNIHDQFMYDMMRERENFSNIAPSVLSVLNIPAPKGMEGKSLF